MADFEARTFADNAPARLVKIGVTPIVARSDDGLESGDTLFVTRVPEGAIIIDGYVSVTNDEGESSSTLDVELVHEDKTDAELVHPLIEDVDGSSEGRTDFTEVPVRVVGRNAFIRVVPGSTSPDAVEYDVVVMLSSYGEDLS